MGGTPCFDLEKAEGGASHEDARNGKKDAPKTKTINGRMSIASKKRKTVTQGKALSRKRGGFEKKGGHWSVLGWNLRRETSAGVEGLGGRQRKGLLPMGGTS